MYCSNCGKKLSPEDYFCSNCGTPVLRQGLFDDSDTDAHEDAFEETRLFTAEELGQYLNDFEEEQPAEQIEQVSPTNSERSAAVKEEPNDKGAMAKAAAVEVMGAANAFAGKFKGKFNDFKAKQAEKKQAQTEARLVEKEEIEEPIVDSSKESLHVEETEAIEEPVSMKKVVLPVIVLGLIIGLVIGLVLIQPWSNNDGTTANTDQTAVSTVMLLD